jgi:hypothetical protein
MSNKMIDSIEPIYFNFIGYIQSKISKNILEQIKKDAYYVLENRDKFKKYNDILVGNIENEYRPYKIEQILKPILFSLANEYHKYSQQDKSLVNWNIDDIWINYQKKYEYNPLHTHSGDLSFVLWVQLPYNLQEELQLPNSKNSINPSNSMFEFVHMDHLGKIKSSRIPLDKSDEGKIVIFSSSLSHIVYPFYTSDDYRISVSGNLTKKEQKTLPSSFHFHQVKK